MAQNSYQDSAVILDSGQRDYMEDAYSLEFGGDQIVYGGVYDGHGGKKAAEFLSDNLLSLFIEILSTEHSPKEAFRKAYVKADERLKADDSGACAANFFIEENTIFWANAGDSRIIVIKEDDCEQLTVDHRLDNEQEQERIEEAGATIRYPYLIKGGRGMMPTRAIGDEYFQSVGLTPEPDTGEYEIKDEDRFLIAGTDGLFDVVDNEEIADLARGCGRAEDLKNSIEHLVLEERNGKDNVAVILISLV